MEFEPPPLRASGRLLGGLGRQAPGKGGQGAAAQAFDRLRPLRHAPCA
jgi:hypothetical protein